VRRSRGRTFAAVVLASLLVGPALRPATAAGPAPAPSGATGYSGRGQIVVQTSIGGAGNITLGGDIALEERGAFLRVDVLSLAIPGVDATLNSVLSTQLFPPGGFTIVYDREAGTYTLWSVAKRVYYSSAQPAGATPVRGAPPATAAALGAVGDIFGAFAFVKGLRNDSAFSASVSLAGHGVVNGHPATGLDYQYARTSGSGDRTEVHGRFQFADDLDAIPVQVTASGKSQAFPQSSLRLDLTTLVRGGVGDTDLHVPPGFTRVTDLGNVLGKTLSL
jgi:hypothetical protein